MDHEGRVIELNPAAEEVFGVARQAALGQPMEEIVIPPRLRDGHRRGLERYLATGESKLIGARAGGKEFPVEVGITSTLINERELKARIATALRFKRAVDQEINQLRRIKDHLAKFVPETVKRLVTANPDAPELAKNKRDVSVLFVDISGYTRLCEELPAAVVNELLERYF